MCVWGGAHLLPPLCRRGLPDNSAAKGFEASPPCEPASGAPTTVVTHLGVLGLLVDHNLKLPEHDRRKERVQGIVHVHCSLAPAKTYSLHAAMAQGVGAPPFKMTGETL